MKTLHNTQLYKAETRLLAVISFLFAMIYQVSPAASASEPSFCRLTIANGLSHYSVMTTYQDERGLLWIGTRGGLDVYDGTHIKNYRRIPGDDHSPMNNYVRAVLGDRSGHVFVLTIQGISIYDIATDRFSNFEVKQASAITYGAGRIFYALGRRVAAMTPDGEKVPAGISDLPSEITVLHAADSVLYIGTMESGLFRRDLRTGKTVAVMPDKNVTCIFPDRNGTLWVGTHADGLYLIGPSGELQNFRHTGGDAESLSSNFIRAICRDSGGDLWVGTFGGLSRYRKDGSGFDNYLTGTGQSDDPERQTHSSVWSLTCDLQGTIWIGTYFNGLMSYNPESDIFTTYKAENIRGKALSFPVAGEMAEDSDGMIWIATEGGGINRLNPATGRIDWYIQPGNAYNNVKAVKYDPSRKCLWIGTHLGGLKKYDIVTGRYSVYPLPNDKANIVCDIEYYNPDTLMLATHDGVYRFNVAEGTFTPMFHTGAEGFAISLALDLVFDHARILWIGGAEGGLYSYNFKSGRMTQYRHDENDPATLCSDNINFLYVTPSNELWVGTSEAGFDRLDRERGQFIHHAHKDGMLPSDCVLGASQLGDGRMLVLTDKALAILGDDSSTSYSIGKAIPLSAFNNKAVYLAADGSRAYAGGIDGLVSFDPKDLKPREVRYSVFPSRLVVGGREITPGDGSGILQDAMSVTKSLTLKSSYDLFTIYYAITDFTHDSNLNPQYRLEGYSEDWQPLPADYGISLTNLSSGNYRLHVRGSADPGGPGSVMDIRILPPLFLHWYCIVGYILIAALVCWLGIRTYHRRISIHQAIAIERQHSRDIEELNRKKLQFFISISNEFRTPLALIIGKMESLMRSPEMPHALLNKINGTYTNCILLRDMMAELLDFRRYEQGTMSIKVGEHNVVKFLAEIFSLFRDYAADKGIRFRFNRSNESLMLWYEPAQMRKVINNLLSNAFKHTPAGGEITLSVRRGDGTVVIEVSDTGSGIAPEDMDKVFKRFYDADSDMQGIGLGLALAKGIVELHHGRIEVFSSPGQSTSFVVTLPLGCKHFSEDQIAGTDDYRQAQEYNIQHIRHNTSDETPVGELAETIPLPADIMVLAEGNAQLREMLSDIFRPYFHVLATGDGTEALSMIDGNVPRLIVSGYSLPGISGVELCRKVKSRSATADTPYVFVSSHSADHEVLEALNAGADDYLTLPFDVRQLLARCRNLILKHNKISGSLVAASVDDNTDPMRASGGADMAFMRRATEVIEKNMAESDFNIGKFAAEMNVSRTSLFLRIKTITGQTPNDFIVSIKMDKAAKILVEDPQASISDISYRLGFSSPRYFSRCFKDWYNQSPREYRAARGNIKT